MNTQEDIITASPQQAPQQQAPLQQAPPQYYLPQQTPSQQYYLPQQHYLPQQYYSQQQIPINTMPMVQYQPSTNTFSILGIILLFMMIIIGIVAYLQSQKIIDIKKIAIWSTIQNKWFNKTKKIS